MSTFPLENNVTEVHVSELIVDYALNLLPSAERKRVEAHAARCHDCRDALRRERDLGPLVRQTIIAAGQTSPQRLWARMPARKRSWLLTWQRQLALVSAVVILCLAGLSWRQMTPEPAWYSAPASLSPTALVATATSTQTPTALSATALTAAAASADIGGTVPADNAPIQVTISLDSGERLSHRPAATPIAALLKPDHRP